MRVGWTGRLAMGWRWAALLLVPACTLCCVGQWLPQRPARYSGHSGVQVPARSSTPTPNLALVVTPGKPSHGLPFTFTLSLRNLTTHIIRLPQPEINCSAIPNGTLYFYFDYTPSPPSSAPGKGISCTEDFVHSRDSILQQIASWYVLTPGQSLSFPTTLRTVVASPPRPGTYTISARYVPPFVLPDEQVALTLRGIDIPNAELHTGALVYRIDPPRLRR